MSLSPAELDEMILMAFGRIDREPALVSQTSRDMNEIAVHYLAAVAGCREARPDWGAEYAAAYAVEVVLRNRREKLFGRGNRR